MNQQQDAIDGARMGRLWAQECARESVMIRRLAAGTWTEADDRQLPMMDQDDWCQFWEDYAGTAHPSEEFVNAFITAAMTAEVMIELRAALKN